MFTLDRRFRKQLSHFALVTSKQEPPLRVQGKEEPGRTHPQVPHLSTVSTGVAAVRVAGEAQPPAEDRR